MKSPAEVEIGKETKDFIKKESKDWKKISTLIAIVGTIMGVIGVILGAWIQSGGFNPPAEPDVDVVFQGINYTENAYKLQIYNSGDAMSGDIILKITFHRNVSIKYDSIYCSQPYAIYETSKKDNSFTLEWNLLLPKDGVYLYIPFKISGGEPEEDYMVYGMLQPIGEKAIDLKMEKLAEFG